MSNLNYDGFQTPQGKEWGKLYPESTSLQILQQSELLGKTFNIYGTVENPLFLAKDVAEWIEYSDGNVSAMLRNIDEDEKVKIFGNLSYLKISTKPTESNSYVGANHLFITEDGLYEVLMQSTKPLAKQFKKGVKEILKSIRKHGGYLTNEKIEEALLNPDILIQLAQNLKDEKQRRIQAEKEAQRLQLTTEIQSAELTESAPMVKYYKDTLSSVNTMPINVIANDLGMTANKLNKILCEKEIQYKQNGTYVLYAKYRDMGLSKHIPIVYLDNKGETRTTQHMVWFEAGKKFIIELLNNK